MLRSQEEQIENFMQQFSEAFYEGSPPITPPKNWREVFNLLTRAIKTIPKTKKIVLFFDELPWLVTPNSKLLQSLTYIWNQHWSDDGRVKLIVCGSSSSWIIKKLLKIKVGCIIVSPKQSISVLLH